MANDTTTKEKKFLLCFCVRAEFLGVQLHFALLWRWRCPSFLFVLLVILFPAAPAWSLKKTDCGTGSLFVGVRSHSLSHPLAAALNRPSFLFSFYPPNPLTRREKCIANAHFHMTFQTTFRTVSPWADGGVVAFRFFWVWTAENWLIFF
jgi:hypothetical protein